MEFVEMTKKEFEQYVEEKIKRYSLTLSQNVIDENENINTMARNQLHNLLPDGIHTYGHYLFHIKIETETFGYLWIKEDKEKRSAFLYEIYLFHEYRNLGYGTYAMRKVEDWMKQKNLLFLKLHVFGSNKEARKLYEKIGFEIAGVNMYKKLDG